jgi:hypothetical protein
MKRILFFATIIAVALFNHPQAFSQEEATKPAYKTGDTWRFTAKSGGTIGSDPSIMLNGTYELSIVTGKLKIWAVTGSEKEELEPRPLPLFCLLGYCQNLDFPLTVGKQWKRNYSVAPVGSNRPLPRTVTYEVKGIEQVTTPAGTFRAFKVESDDRYSGRDFWITNYWYSPETKSIVKYQFDATSKEILSSSNSRGQVPRKVSER